MSLAVETKTGEREHRPDARGSRQRGQNQQGVLQGADVPAPSQELLVRHLLRSNF